VQPLGFLIGAAVEREALPLVEGNGPSVAVQHPEVRRGVTDRRRQQPPPQAGAVAIGQHVERHQLELSGAVPTRSTADEADQRTARLGDPGGPGRRRDPLAPPIGARVERLRTPVVEDPLRHQPGVRLLPDLEVQRRERLGVGGPRGPDRALHGRIIS
jgi:hypothetical protein